MEVIYEEENGEGSCAFDGCDNGCGSNGSEKAPETAKAQTEAGAAESGEAREGGGTIVYGSNDYTRINPAMDEHGEIKVLIFDGLTDNDGNNEVVPRLAKSGL